MEEDKKQAQESDNYAYDQIGNLIRDKKEGIVSIEWTVYGKISRIIRDEDKDFSTVGDRTTIDYSYDASGNRINKTVTNSSGIAKTTWYVRDASGNTMSIYESGTTTLNNGDLTQTELHVYGSSRLGIFHPDRNMVNIAQNSTGIYTFRRGEKFFELSNHLGNVLVTVSDKKIGHDNGSGTIDYYTGDVVTAQDYYPFGSLMPSRKFAANNSYRYGFNGKENDNEVKGEGNQQDYGFRIYDSRVGRFLSVDPLTKKYPELTPYQFASNSPIQGVDLDGREIFHYTITENSQGEAVLKLTKTEELKGRGNNGIKRYVVTYEHFYADIKWSGDEIKDILPCWETQTYHIGFPQYGVGYANAWKAEDFERDYIKKTGNYLQFGNDYVDDPHSQTGSDVGYALNAQNSASEITVPVEAIKPNRGRGTALESQGNTPAHNFESAAEGAMSDVATKKRLVPTLKYDNPNAEGVNFIKFDGSFGELNFIDRKLNVTRFPKSVDQVRRAAEALRQNPGATLRYEVPFNKVKEMQGLLRKAGQQNNSNITVVGVPTTR